MASVAQMPSQNDIHPLLRHPQPITRDFARAQRMLGLIADSEENLTGLHRAKSKTTKWLERPLHARLDVSDVESEKGEHHEQKTSEKAMKKSNDEGDEDLLNRRAKLDRPTSFSSENAVQIPVEPKTKPDTLSSRRRPIPLKSLRPVSYHAQHLLSPEWTASPSTMSPNTSQQRPVSMQPNSPAVHRSSFSSTSSSGSVQHFAHPQTWPAPLPQQWPTQKAERPVSYQPPSSASEHDSVSFGSPQLNEQRPRPTSFATYQHRDRRSSKIASSRGLRNNSYPNFSNPVSGIAPRAVAGENIESDAIYTRFDDTTVGPPSPSLPVRAAINVFENCNDRTMEENKEKKTKKRWSAIPQTFKKLTSRRPSAAAQEKRPEISIDELRRMNLTDDNLARCETEDGHPQAALRTLTSGGNSLPTPTYSPSEYKSPFFEATLPPPFAPWADAPPSPALTHDRRRGSEMSLSPTRRRAPSRLSIENTVQGRPDSMYSMHSMHSGHSVHSRQSSLGMPSPARPMLPTQLAVNVPASPRTGSRRGTPSLERNCIICKTAKEPSAIVNRRISGNCWHEPATCFECLRSHVEQCVNTRGWEHCTCPECNELMTYEDMAAFANDNSSFIKWED